MVISGLLFAGVPLHPAEEKESRKAKGAVDRASSRGNLSIPRDLPDDAKKSLTEAVKTFHAAAAAGSDQA